MGLFNIFSGKSPSDYERKGDALASDKVWGEAKLAFETGLDKLTKGSSIDAALADRLTDKLHQSKEALAMSHCQEAIALMDAGCMEDAHELLILATELTVDPQLKEDLNQKIRQTSVQDRPVIQTFDADLPEPPDEPETDPFHEDADDYFSVILSALPEEIGQAYRTYGDHFKQGYLALNRGDFRQAVEHLIRAVEENPSSQSLVPLELATAYANLGQSGEAQALLEDMVRHRPDVLPAYQLLCDIYWEEKCFDKALRLLDTLPSDLARSMAAYQIKGETLLQAGRFEDATSFFQNLFETYDWNESVALGLARAHEASGRQNEARNLYQTLISQCTGCGSRIDPAIKRKYADLSFATGNFTTEVLEYYLELSRQDPGNAMQYCENISRIYAELGNDAESRRFQSFAEELARQR